MLILLTALAHGAVCADDTVDALERSMADVIEANRNVDEVGFASASKLMDAALTCLDKVPASSTQARIHHTMALRAFINGQTRASKRGLAALRLLDPRWEPPFPRGHPFTELWVDATDPGPVTAIGSIKPKAWIVDGVQADDVPLARGYLLQVRDEAGQIQLTRYLFDPSDVPDFGQDREVDTSSTPWTLSVRGLAIGRAFGQTQSADGSVALTDQGASSLGFGGEGVVRITPSAAFGAEANLAIVGDDDLIGSASQPAGVEASGLLLLGGGLGAVAGGQLFAAGRVGVVTDTIRTWPRAGSGVEPSAWRLWGPSIGGEVGVRNRTRQVDLAVDGALAGFTAPWRADARVGATQLITETVGLRAQAVGRSSSQALFDGDEQAGRSSENELRLSAGIDLVF